MNISISDVSDEDNANGQSPITKKQKTVPTGKNKKRKHNPTSYNAKLEKEFPFLQAFPSDSSKAQCKLCSSSSTGRKPTFRCERSDIERHLKSERHVSALKSVKAGNPKSLETFLAKEKLNPLEKQMKYAEMKLAGFVAAHNEPFFKMNHLTDVLKKIFPDSQIAQSISCKKTKTKGMVLNVLGQDEKEHLATTLKEIKFSILTDESTDISSVKTSCIMLRFYCRHQGKIASRFWDLQQVFSENDAHGAAEGATARRLFELIQKSLIKYDIPFKNVIGFGTDGCNVMMGSQNSVASRMKELCPGLRVCKCICHSLHLCCSEACKCLPRSCEDLARNIYNFFNSSAKRRAQFAEFQIFLELDVLRMLHPSQTRWLSLLPVINRILNQWEALRLFFDAKWLGERLESTERIHILLNDPITKAFYFFLEWVLPKVTKMNEFFQSEKPVATFVHERMVNSYKDLLTSFARRDYVCMTPINDIRPNDESKWLPLNQLYLGVNVMKQINLPELSERHQIVQDFRIKCRLFLITLCVQIKQRYDFDDPIMQRLNVLAPEIALSQKERERTPSLHTLACLQPRIVDPNDTGKLQTLDDQWRALPFQIENLPQQLKCEKDPEAFWHQLYIFENEIGERPFSILALFALETLSVPISNADCERTFSKINDIKTKKRNRLLTKTVCGLLHADAVVRENSKCCIGFEPRKSMYDKMTSQNIYKSSDKNATDEEDEIDENIFSN